MEKLLRTGLRNWFLGWFTSLLLYLDDWRVRRHLQRAEWQLRRREKSDLSPQLQAARARHLDQLNLYWRRRRFPRNRQRAALYAPCFVDGQGRTCAVAHLLEADGQTPLMERVVREANYAYVPEMQFPELESWAGQSGLTGAELALIQPTYPCPEVCLAAAQEFFSQSHRLITQIVMTGAGLSLAICLANLVALFRRQRVLLQAGALIGVMVSAGFLYVTNDFLWKQTLLMITGSIPCPGAGVGNICHPSLAHDLRDLPLRQAGQGVLMSLFFLWLSWAVLFESIRLRPWRWSRLLLILSGTAMATAISTMISFSAVRKLARVGELSRYNYFQPDPWNTILFAAIMAFLAGGVIYFFSILPSRKQLEQKGQVRMILDK